MSRIPKLGLPVLALLVPAVALAGSSVRSGMPSEAEMKAVSRSVTRVLKGIYTQAELADSVYVGSEVCLSCHADRKGFRSTQHAFALIRPMTEWSMKPTKGVMADTDHDGVDDFVQGLDFNTISSAYDVYKPNAPKLSVVNGTYTITIGGLSLPVVFARQLHEKDGSWLQRFAVRVPASDGVRGYARGVYMSGVAITEGHYFDDGLKLFYGDDKKPRWSAPPTVAQIVAAGNPFDASCVGCHVTGLRGFEKTAQGEMTVKTYPATLFAADDPAYVDYDGDGNADLVNIGCEACHGPGSLHVTTDRSKIANPREWPPNHADEVCGQCHSRFRSLPNNTFSFPFRDDTMTQWRPGSGLPLSDFYVDKNSYWPDGVDGKSTHLQYNEFRKSPHATNPYHKVRCTDCHDAHHDTGTFAQLKMQVTQGGVTMATSNENNTICTSCHAGYGPFASLKKTDIAAYGANVKKIAKVTAEHTHHPYAPERTLGLSRCSGCHMPIAGTLPGGSVYSTPRHAFTFMSPEKAIGFLDKGGQPTGCGVSCHNARVNSFGLGYHIDTKWNDSFDVTLAKELLKYFGPNGLWWATH